MYIIDKFYNCRLDMLLKNWLKIKDVLFREVRYYYKVCIE